MASKLTTEIILKGVTDPSLSAAFKNASKLADSNLGALKKAGETAKKVAAVAGAAAIGASVASVNAAIDYESAFAGVMKTVDETSSTSYETLSKGIRQMAKETPTTAAEIAEVAEAAGQLGIKADDVLKFSKTMIDLGNSTNLSSDEAATAIARFFNVAGTSMDDVDKFGSTLVALGNNAATTESDIMNLSSRIVGSAHQIGMTEPQVLALATTMSSVGIGAELGGTAISSVMTKIDKAVSTNSKTLGTWAKTAGMSTSEFKEVWEKDAYGALTKVIGGMGELKKNGGNLNILLDELKLNNSGVTDTMKKLSSATGLMGDMTKLANASWEENAALSTEANTRYGTMASKIQMLKNNFYDMGITIGNALMPYVEKLLDKISKIDFDAVAQKVAGAIDEIVEVGKKLMPILAAIAGAFVAVKILAFVKGLIAAAKVIMSVIKAFGLLQTVLTVLGGPVTIVVALIGALVGAFIYLWNTSESFRNFWKNLWKKIKELAGKAVDAIKIFFTETIPNAIDAMVEWFKELPGKIWTWLVETANKIAEWGVGVWEKAKEIGSNFIQGVVNFFQQLPYMIGYIVGYALEKIRQWGVNILNWITTTLPQIIGDIVNWFAQLPGRIWTWLTDAAQKVVAWGSDIWNKGTTAASEFITGVINFIMELPGKVWTWLCDAAAKVVQWGSDLLTKGKAAAGELVSGVMGVLSELPGKVLEVGANMVSKLWDGIVGAKDWLVGKVSGFVSGIISGFKGGKASASKSSSIAKHATGGTFTQPHLAVVGDAPETIVPHGNTSRNRSLLSQAAKGVGATIGNTINVTFAPVINGGNAEENRKMLQDEEQAFEQRMDEYFNGKVRLAF